MKKQYIKPTIIASEIDTTEILAGSGPFEEGKVVGEDEETRMDDYILINDHSYYDGFELSKGNTGGSHSVWDD